jgi:3-oxoacyl-[acyl-carrier protein] reductase
MLVDEKLMTDFLRLDGQTALVTGAATGIGAAIAARLAHAGAKVLIADVNGEAASATAAQLPGAMGVQMDVTDPASIQAALKAAGATVDILVNNAGVAGMAAPLWDYDEQDWKRVFAVNVDGVFNCCRAVIGPMRENKYGRIINIASVAGKEGNPRMSAYSASKAAVIGFTKSLAKEVATEASASMRFLPQLSRQRFSISLRPSRFPT